MDQQALYLVDNLTYLHVQSTDGGWDYTLYDKDTKRQVDGGLILTEDVEDSPVSSLLGAVRTLVFVEQGMQPAEVTFQDISILEELQAAQMTFLSAGR